MGEGEQVSCVQSTVFTVMAATLDLGTVARCNIDLLARVCQNRKEIWGGIVRAVKQHLGENCSLETVHKAGDILASVLSSPACTNPQPLLDSLDAGFSEISHVVRQEVLSRITVTLANLNRRNGR